MASIPDASMEPASIIETIDFSEGAIVWLHANHQKLEEMVEKKQTMYNLEDWEEFERWAYSKTKELDQAKIKKKEAETTQGVVWERMQRMQAERKEMMARIAYLEKGATFSSMKGFPEFGIGMIALERLVCDATKELPPDGEIGQLPPDGEALIIERLDKLVARMARMEKWRNDLGLCLSMQWQGDCRAFDDCHSDAAAADDW